jgi:hypothetical protein
MVKPPIIKILITIVRLLESKYYLKMSIGLRRLFNRKVDIKQSVYSLTFYQSLGKIKS